MADQRKRKRKRAGSEKRDQNHRPGGDWTTMAVPVGMKIFKAAVGISKVDIVPYEVGEGNRNADPGEWYYERTYFRHVQIGANKSMYICSAATYNRPCPICDHLTKLASDPHTEQEILDALKPKERQLFLLVDHDAIDDGVQLWDVAPFNFGSLLDEERRAAEEDEDYIRDFDDELAGASLKIRFAEERIGKTKFPKAGKIDFKARPKGLNSKWLEHGICLDSILKEMDYDELKSIFLQTGAAVATNEGDQSNDGDKEEAPSAAKQVPTAEECGIQVTDEVFYKDELCTVFRISKDGTSLVLMDSDDNPIKAVGADDVAKAEDAKDEIPKNAEPVAAVIDSDDDDSFDEDWDDD